MRRLSLLLSALLLAACHTAAPAPEATPPADAALPDSSQFEPDIAAFEAEDARVRRMPGAVVFVGSSSIRLWSGLHEDFPGTVLPFRAL